MVHAFSFNHVSVASMRARSTRTCSITQSSFVRKKSTYHPTARTSTRGRNRNPHQISMLRNFDLPEALIFYGLDTVLDVISSPSPSQSTTASIRPGVLRLIDEAKEIDIPTFILSEHLTMTELSKAVESVEPSFQQLCNDNIVHYRSSLEEFVVTEDFDSKLNGDDNADEDASDADEFIPFRFIGEGIGHAPCPAALYDAVNTVLIEPKGFGGSAGFGVKNWEAVRTPLPQHCVVFVSSASDNSDSATRSDSDGKYNRSTDLLDRSDGSGSISRDRCIASRYAGMRAMYIEDAESRLRGEPCTAEDVADGFIESLGTEEDWEMVTLDDISSPGSFWLNMMQPKDPDRNTVNTADIIEEYITRRNRKGERSKMPTSDSAPNDEPDKPDDEELARILADLESF